MFWSNRTSKMCKLVEGEIFPCSVESSKGDNMYLGIVGNVVFYYIPPFHTPAADRKLYLFIFLYTTRLISNLWCNTENYRSQTRSSPDIKKIQNNYQSIKIIKLHSI